MEGWLFLSCWYIVVDVVLHEEQRWIKRPNELTRTFRDGMSQKDTFKIEKKR
jgi:hypothetical protein